MDGHAQTYPGNLIRRSFERSRLEPQLTALAYSVAWPLNRLRLEPAEGGTPAPPQAPAQSGSTTRRQAAGA